MLFSTLSEFFPYKNLKTELKAMENPLLFCLMCFIVFPIFLVKSQIILIFTVKQVDSLKLLIQMLQTVIFQ